MKQITEYKGKTAKTFNWFFPVIFLILTFVLMFLREPFFDEAHAWMVSKSFSFLELFKIERYEGHLFIWHTLLAPFSKNNLFYPYSMYILNWIFCAGAVIVFWNKAPFSIIEKTLITFSYPFVWYFAIVARCYSIGIFFLFLILSYWNERLKHPVLISFLLIILANTSAMALIGAFSLGLIFIYDLFKKNKFKNIYPFLIMLFGALLVLIQLFGAHHPDVLQLAGQKIFFYNLIVYFYLFDFKNFDIFYIQNKITAFIILASYVVSCFYFYKNKRALFFFLTTFILMFLLFAFKYSGAWWHYLFFYIYLISSIWLLRLEKEQKSIFSKIFNILFLTLLLSFCLTTLFFHSAFNSEVYNSKTREISEIINQKKIFEGNKKIYALDAFFEASTGIIPYYDNIEIYNAWGNKKYTLDEYKHYTESGKREDLIDSLCASLDKNKLNIGITGRKMYPFYNGFKYYLTLKPLYQNNDPRFTIYEIRGIKK